MQIIVLALVGGNARAGVAPLTAQPALAIPRNVGYFDYMVVAIDSAHHRLFVAGTNGKLVAIDTATGRVTSSIDVAAHVDQIALDAARGRL